MYKVQRPLIIVLVVFFIVSCSAETSSKNHSETITSRVSEKKSGGCAICKPNQINESEDQDIEKVQRY